MSARKSRVRPVPDFSRAHQLVELQLEARKNMKKCTKVEEFNLSRPFVRGDGSSATPVQCLDILKPSPRHLDCARGLQTNPVQSPFVSSSKPKDCTTTNGDPGQGQKRRATGILKNAGKPDDATTGRKQARCSGAPLARRPRVTFDIASPLRESPASVRRVRVTGWSGSPGRTGPKTGGSKMMITYGRVPIEPRNGTAHSMQPQRSQPQRVLLLGSGQRIPISQSCSRASFMGGLTRFRADSIAKAIDFNEESEEDGKSSATQDVSKDAEQPVETTISFKTTNKKFAGLKGSPVSKIHVDVTENEDASVSSSLLRLNSNSSAMIRSPLLNMHERIEWKDAKGRSRLPQPRDLKGKAADKENRPKEKKRKSQDQIVAGGGSQCNKLDTIESVSSEDQQRKREVGSPSIKRDALEQLEVGDTFDANQTINRLEKKAQRLRRRSQLTEEKSEQDYIMKKLEALQKKIESMRMVFHSMQQTGDESSTAGDGGGSYGRSISVSNDAELMRNESNVCPTDDGFSESRSIHDAWPDSSAVESMTESQPREDTCETQAFSPEVEPERRDDTLVSHVLVRAVSGIAPESTEDVLSKVLHVPATEAKSVESGVPCFVSEIDSRSKDGVLCCVTLDSELRFEEGATIYDVLLISKETESQSEAESEIDVPRVSLEIESRPEDDFKYDNRRSALLADDSDSKENVDPLGESVGAEDVSPDSSNRTGTDNPLRNAEPCERIIFQDITGEIQRRATQLDEDDGVFIVEESSDDSDLMNSEDFTEWSSSPVALNRCLTNIESELSSELSMTVSPEDVLTERLAKFSISDRLETSKVEASPNMSSEFVQYNRYEWREGVDGSARLFNPVAAALIDTETDDAHFVPIVPSP